MTESKQALSDYYESNTPEPPKSASFRMTLAYVIAAAAGLGLIWVPHEMFYEPEVFFAKYY